jgi:hypothetical protein
MDVEIVNQHRKENPSREKSSPSSSNVSIPSLVRDGVGLSSGTDSPASTSGNADHDAVLRRCGGNCVHLCARYPDHPFATCDFISVAIAAAITKHYYNEQQFKQQRLQGELNFLIKREKQFQLQRIEQQQLGVNGDGI